jgi:hypothetical protein
MNPFRYLVQHFDGTPYGPWVDVLLFGLFASMVVACVWRLLGLRTQKFLTKAISRGCASLLKGPGFAPEWRTVSLAVGPYVDLGYSVYCALVGIWCVLLLGAALGLGYSHAPRWAIPAAWGWMVLGFWYMGRSLQNASWAYHRIRQRRTDRFRHAHRP